EELRKQHLRLSFDLDKTARQKNGFTILPLIMTTIFIIQSITVVTVFQPQTTTYAQGDNWYVGKGLESDTYYTFEIRELDTNQGRSFLMTIYFKGFDSENGIWIAPVFVVDQGRVFNGTFHLSDLDLSALGSSQIPPELQEYRNAYSNSLQWLASFVPKPGQSLSAPNWGKIAAIGGSAISPSGSAEVTVPAGTFDTTVVSWHYGEDNRIWINPNMPYPVKAETYAAVTTGNAPIQYAFELQATGQGQPPLPESEFQAPEPPITVRTPRGTYIIQLIWNPPIPSGTPEEFGLIFMDDTQSIQDRVTYGFTVTQANGTVISELENQRAAEGTSTQTVTFPEPGRYTIETNVQSVAGQPLGIFVESSRFTVLAE
ncbi:MAG: hypothetical protein ACRD4W_11590, partial [Nitrososphaeraceae archaeon]